jgi:hypothetical protein
MLLTRRDGHSPSDWLYVSLDSYDDNRTAFEFSLNAAGVKQDLRRFDDDNMDWDWDAVWEGEVDVNDAGWTAEFQIPFRELRFNTGPDMEWGLQVYREYPRNNNEYSVWNYWSKDETGFVSNYGVLKGLKNIKAGKPLYVVPYVVGKSHINDDLVSSVHPDNYDNSTNMGVDFKYSFKNGLTLNGTVNPDFGQVEADPGEYNLTEFESFFSEKRPFFMEGGNILKFSMGFGDGDNSNNTLFYSRRIGRTPHDAVGTDDSGDNPIVSVNNPDFVNIVTALKLTGKTPGGLSIGLLNAITDEEEAIEYFEDGTKNSMIVEPKTNFFLSRVQQDLRNGQTVIGGILTATRRDLKNTGMDWLHENAYTGGVDLTHEFFDRNYYIQSALSFSQVEGSTEAIYDTQTSSTRYYQRPDADHLSVDESATSLSGNSLKLVGGKSSGRFRGAVGLFRTSPGFEVNDMGFGRRSDTFMQFTWFSIRGWDEGKVFREYQINFNQWVDGNSEFDVYSKGGNINAHGTFLNNWRTGGGIGLNASGLSISELRGGPAIYKPSNINIWYNIHSDFRKPVSFGAFASVFHNEDDVESVSFGPEISYRAFDNLQISVETEYSKFSDTWAWRGIGLDSNSDKHYIFSDLDQKTLSMEMRADYTVTTNLSIQFYGQALFTAGEYTNFRETDQVRAASFNERFSELENAITDLDVNGNDVLDIYNDQSEYYTFEDGIWTDFNYKEFRTNLVIRWEFQTGSSLFFVWSDGYTHSKDEDVKFDFSNDVEDLFNQSGDNVFLLKLNYLLNI